MPSPAPAYLLVALIVWGAGCGRDAISDPPAARCEFLQGGLSFTGRSGDVAIVGDGFLRARAGDDVLLTRGGAMLVVPGGELLDLEGRTIELLPAAPPGLANATAPRLPEFSVSPEGLLSFVAHDGELHVRRILLFQVDSPEDMQKLAPGVFLPPPSAGWRPMPLPMSSFFVQQARETDPCEPLALDSLGPI